MRMIGSIGLISLMMICISSCGSTKLSTQQEYPYKDKNNVTWF